MHNDKELKEIHKEAIERFKIAEQAERQQRRDAVSEMRFVNVEGAQWDDNVRAKRSNRPMYSINRIAGAMDQLVGDQRQNRVGGKVRPVSGGASLKTANILSGVIRNIESASNATNSYDNAYDEELGGGYGGWRVVTKLDEDSFDEQSLFIAPIKSAATSLWFDPSAEEYDKRDGGWAFLVTSISKDTFKRKYKNATETDFSKEIVDQHHCELWASSETVMVAEYWRKTPIMRHIALMSDGKVIDVDEDGKVIDELAAKGTTVLKQKKVKSHKVEMFKMSGAEILSSHKWPGKYIPLIPCFGKQVTIESKQYTRGLVKFAKDPQKIYNHATSAIIEAQAKAPKDPIWLTDTQAKGRESELNNYNSGDSIFLFYTHDPNEPGAPKRTGAPAVQSGLIEQKQQAIADLDATLNVFDSMRGNASPLLSEQSVQNQVTQGNSGSFIYQDNLVKSIKYTHEILIDLIPRIIDTPRMIRMLGIDGKSELVAVNVNDLNEINENVTDLQTGEVVIVNDLSIGKYDVVVEAGPAFATQRQEATNQLIELSKNSEMFSELTPDLIAKGLNLVNGDEFVQRVRKVMITNGIVTPTAEEVKDLGLDQKPEEDPGKQALTDNVLIQTEELKSKINLNDAKTQNELVDMQGKTIDALKELMSVMQAKIDLGLSITPLDKAIVVQQTDLVLEAQDVIQGSDNPNSEQLDDLVTSGQIEDKDDEREQEGFDNA